MISSFVFSSNVFLHPECIAIHAHANCDQRLAVISNLFKFICLLLWAYWSFNKGYIKVFNFIIGLKNSSIYKLNFVFPIIPMGIEHFSKKNRRILAARKGEPADTKFLHHISWYERFEENAIGECLSARSRGLEPPTSSVHVSNIFIKAWTISFPWNNINSLRDFGI